MSIAKQTKRLLFYMELKTDNAKMFCLNEILQFTICYIKDICLQYIDSVCYTKIHK